MTLDSTGSAQALAPSDDDDADRAPIDRFQLLDVYALGVVRSDEPARVDALATISAGDRAPSDNGRPGVPRVSRDGTMKLHDADGRAPGLKAALAATGYKKLQIAVGFDDPELFLQQRFTSYTASALKLYGDQYRLMEIVTQGEPGKGTAKHVLHEAGTARYAELLGECKVSASLYFVLADWDENNRPRVLMPDGLGFYRLRTTSRHSLRNILGTLQYLSRFTGGRLAGVPLELQITYREVADPFGIKRNVPTWSLAMKPPHGIVLDTRNFAPLVQQALDEGRALHVPTPDGKMLMAPRVETWEVAAADGPVEVEPDDADIARLMAGDAPADRDFWRRRWHGSVRGSKFGTDAGRAEWMLEYSDKETNSLSTWLQTASNAEAEAMILAVADRVRLLSDQEVSRVNARRYEEIFGDDDDDRSKPADTDTEPEADAEQQQLDPDVGECESCGVVTRLVLDEDSGSLVCADRQACARRQTVALDAHTWLDDVRERIANHADTQIADYDRRRQIGMLIQRSTTNDAAASRELLRILTGSASLARLSDGACEVIETEARRADWPDLVKHILAGETAPSSA